MKKTYNLYTDQKNAWLEVPSMDVVYLDIYKKISPFSYFAKYVDSNNNNVMGKIYLEEALDLTLFEQADKKAFKVLPVVVVVPKEGFPINSMFPGEIISNSPEYVIFVVVPIRDTTSTSAPTL